MWIEVSEPVEPPALVEAPLSPELRSASNHQKWMPLIPTNTYMVGARWEVHCAAGEPRRKIASVLPHTRGRWEKDPTGGPRLSVGEPSLEESKPTGVGERSKPSKVLECKSTSPHT
uniref:Predicted protein n=1 Tax=Hordeum vulgare subsp. vulgare TaxID=112509 RepID=F2E5Q6_HORVV|nr:predicted protein [Hordeum vulgare subsp. vulgare]